MKPVRISSYRSIANNNAQLFPMQYHKLNLLLLREQFSWMGKYSGYDQVFNAMVKQDNISFYSVYRDLRKTIPVGLRRIAQYFSRKLGGTEFYCNHSLLAELTALWLAYKRQCRLLHIAYVENNLGLLSRISNQFGVKIIGTVHQPSSWWELTTSNPEIVSKLNAIIVLSTSEIDFFNKYLQRRVFFIPHGVDVEFFRPPTKNEQNNQSLSKTRCLFAGNWLRDLKTLASVINKIMAVDDEIVFDIIVSPRTRNTPAMRDISRHDRVFWHAALSDTQLRSLYWKADMLVLPLINCTANNVLLEAIACGLPIITNIVGGIRDYATDSFALLSTKGDVDAMVENILCLAGNSKARREKGKAARLYAEKNFAWSIIARKTTDLYKYVLK